MVCECRVDSGSGGQELLESGRWGLGACVEGMSAREKDHEQMDTEQVQVPLAVSWHALMCGYSYNKGLR